VNEDSYERLEVAVGPVLSQEGYDRVDALTYKARWGTAEVEHFIYFEEGGKTKGLFSGLFGIRNPDAEAFSVDAIRRYGSEFQFKVLMLRYDARTSCTMRFPFHQFTPPLWDLNISFQSDREIGDAVRHIVVEHVHPSVGNLITADGLLSVLVRDERPCSWAYTSGAIRAAQIVALATKSGLCSRRIRLLLEPRRVNIANGFPKASPMRANPAPFLEGLLADCATNSRLSPREGDGSSSLA
jgi:hypothetical protein